MSAAPILESGPEGEPSGPERVEVTAPVAPAEGSARDPRPVTAEAAMRLAETRFHTRDLVGAEAMAREAVRVGSGPRAQYLLGLVLLAEKKFGAASEAFAETVRLDPGNEAAARQLKLARDAARGER